MRAYRAGPTESEERETGDSVQSEEFAWIVAAREDARAFAPLYSRYVTPIYRYCFRHVRHPETANDLTAQVFIRAIEKLDQYRVRSGATFRSWLFAIARNLVTDFRRRNKSVYPLSDVELDMTADDAVGPEAIAVHQSELDALLDVLEQLSDQQQSIIQFRLAGLTTQEIADALAISQPAVKSTQTRAYARLRTLLATSKEGAP